MSRSWMTWTRRFVALSSLAVLGLVLRDGFRAGADLPANLMGRLALALPLSTLGLVCAGNSWTRLVGVSWRRGMKSFGTSLPLRHLPLGGIGQVVGMSGFSAADGVASRRAIQAGPTFLLATAAGAGIVSAPLIWEDSVPVMARISAALVSLGGVCVWLGGSRVLLMASRKWRPLMGAESLPIRGAVMWSVIAAICAASAFAVLFPASEAFSKSVGGFSLAWLGGFIVVVAPAGLGAREALMVALWSNLDPAEVVAVALVHRVSTLAAEAIVVAIGFGVGRSGDQTVIEEARSLG